MTTSETPSQEYDISNVPVELFEDFRKDLLWMVSSCREKVLLDSLEVEPWRIFKRYMISRQDKLWRTQQELIESADEQALVVNAETMIKLVSESRRLARDLGEYPQNIISRAVCESTVPPTVKETGSAEMDSLPEPGQQIHGPSPIEP